MVTLSSIVPQSPKPPAMKEGARDEDGPAVSEGEEGEQGNEELLSNEQYLDSVLPPIPGGITDSERAKSLIALAQKQYSAGRYEEALATTESVYETDAWRIDNLLLLGAIHFQLKNYSESIFYNQQAIRIDSNFAEAYGNLGNSLRELGDVSGAVQFYLKAIKLKPRFYDAYNNLGSTYMQMGKVKQAVDTYQMALVLNPDLVDAHSNLGNLYKAQGKLIEAKKTYLEAIQIRPDFAIAWNNLAGVFKEEGDLETAIKYYQEAVRLTPDFADAQSNLGNALRDSGRLREAKIAYKRAILLRPDFAVAHGNLASAYYDEGEMDMAIKTYKYALQLEPNFPDALNNLGNALREIGKLDEAIQSFRKCIELKPDHPHAYNNLGNGLKDKNMIKEAMHCYTTACRLMPRFAVAHSNLGSLLKDQGKVEQALAHYAKAVDIDPSFADAYSNMGNAYKSLGQLKDAITCYTKAVRLKPNFAHAYSNLATAYRDGSRFDDAITCYRKALSLKPEFPDAQCALAHCLLQLCDWRMMEDDQNTVQRIVDSQIKASSVLMPSLQPYHSLSFPMKPEQRLALARAVARAVKRTVSLVGLPRFRFKAKAPDARIKVGYVSSNFGSHPSGHAIRGLFRHHNEKTFEVFCYATSKSDGSEVRNKIETHAHHFVDVSDMPSVGIAKRIHADGIHILVDLNGYTEGARPEVFAFRPAPVQIIYGASQSSSGAPWMQYAITDKTIVPALPSPSFDEKLIFMPGSCIINDYSQSARFVLDPDQCPRRDAFGLSEDKVVFANFGQSGKISPDIFDCWCRILKRVRNSVLWLVRFPALSEINLRAEAKARGLKDRQLVFTDIIPRAEHLKRGYLADLYLDTFPHSAQTTGGDTLWSGTPMVTCAGDEPTSRVGASLLLSAGLPSLVAKDMAEYEDIVVNLASDVDKLWELRKQVEEKRLSTKIFDTKTWVRDYEAGILAAWKRHEAGKEPDHIDVATEK